MSNTTEYMTSKEVAGLLNVSIRSVQLWAKAGYLPSLRIGRTIRFKRDEIEARIAQLKR